MRNLESVKEVVSYDDHGTTPSCPAFAADGKFGHLLKFTCLALVKAMMIRKKSVTSVIFMIQCNAHLGEIALMQGIAAAG